MMGNSPLNSWQVVVIGAGASGMMAAYSAAQRGARTLLLEKNRKTGVKILMSGGTRCNITQSTDEKGIAKAFGKQGKFLRSALAALPPAQVVRFFEEAGVPTKVESTGKIFPVSDRALDVRDALHQHMVASGVEVRLDAAVTSISRDKDLFQIQLLDNSIVETQKLIVACGGKSYPGCGTTGDAYAWAKNFGHTIIDPVPALAPVTIDESWIQSLSGVTLPDARVSVIEATQLKSDGLYREKDFRETFRSSLLLTHFGLSGPAAMNVSRAISRAEPVGSIRLVLDFMPHYSWDELFESIKAQCQQNGRRPFLNLLAEQVPRRLAESLLAMQMVPLDQNCGELSKAAMRQVVGSLKAATIRASGTRGFTKAEVTAGGVSLAEVDSRTLESKLVPGLYFVGEVLDVDGPIGGFNFQAAFSTGWLAGLNI
jgi:predicted Rossmann fold flavoprotein